MKNFYHRSAIYFFIATIIPLLACAEAPVDETTFPARVIYETTVPANERFPFRDYIKLDERAFPGLDEEANPRMGTYFLSTSHGKVYYVAITDEDASTTVAAQKKHQYDTTITAPVTFTTVVGVKGRRGVKDDGATVTAAPIL
ncbi:hypothetical protein AA313_de0202691 [Arthrobotrys entomopaga]|nr:hypothetical protein AA313_de0202691 [Arthrobotrys entomopaga]